MSESQLLDWPVVEAVLAGSRLTLLYGPPGTGKTTAAFNAGRSRGQSVFNVTLTDETPAAELRGHYLPNGGTWEWQDGPALRAFRGGGLLILNEIDQASTDCLDFCHALLDDPGIAAITLPTGETVFPHPDFRVVATMNGAVADLRPALRDRLTVAVYVGVPHPDALASLPDDLRAAAENSAGRDMSEDRPATLRAWKAYAALLDAGVTPEASLAAVFAHRAGEVSTALRLAGTR